MLALTTYIRKKINTQKTADESTGDEQKEKSLYSYVVFWVFLFVYIKMKMYDTMFAGECKKSKLLRGEK